MNKKLYELGGWIGVVLCLVGYALLSLGVVSGNSLIYHACMLVGSGFLILISLKKHAVQPAVLNLVFFCLALVALARIVFSTIH